jgi:hypothetical protein
MNGQDVQKRRRAVKFSRKPTPISPSDHDGRFVGAAPLRVDPKVRHMQRNLIASICTRWSAPSARSAERRCQAAGIGSRGLTGRFHAKSAQCSEKLTC